MRVEFIRCACGFEVRALMAAAHAFAWIITLGNISFPLAVLTGLVR